MTNIDFDDIGLTDLPMTTRTLITEEFSAEVTTVIATFVNQTVADTERQELDHLLTAPLTELLTWLKSVGRNWPTSPENEAILRRIAVKTWAKLHCPLFAHNADDLLGKLHADVSAQLQVAFNAHAPTPTNQETSQLWLAAARWAHLTDQPQRHDDLLTAAAAGFAAARCPQQQASTFQLLAERQAHRGQSHAAQQSFQSAIEIASQTTPDHMWAAELLLRSAEGLRTTGNPDAAVSAIRSALARFQNLPGSAETTLLARSVLGLVLCDLAMTDQALPLLRGVLDPLTQLPDIDQHLATCAAALAGLEFSIEDFAAAKTHYELAIARFMHTPNTTQELAMCQLHLGVVQKRLGRLAEAAQSLTQARSVLIDVTDNRDVIALCDQELAELPNH